jgi:hypothetical protein
MSNFQNGSQSIVCEQRAAKKKKYNDFIFWGGFSTPTLVSNNTVKKNMKENRLFMK